MPIYHGNFTFDQQGRINTQDGDLHILVDGPLACGKSAFIETIAEDKLYEERGAVPDADKQFVEDIKDENTKLVFETLLNIRIKLFLGVGKIDLNRDSALYLHEFYRAPSFWEEIKELKLIGGIVLCNSAAPQTFIEARSKVAHLDFFSQEFFCPYIIADTPHRFEPTSPTFRTSCEGLGVETLRSHLMVSQDIPIIQCNVTNKESVKRVLLVLLERVLSESET